MAIHGTIGAVTGSLQIGTSGAAVTTVLDEDNMSTDSATALATQQSIKAYVDASTPDTLGAIGNVTTTSLAAGQVLIYDATQTRWENAGISGTANEIGITAADGALTIGLPDDVTVAGDLTIGADSDGTDRKITFGHSTLKTSIGIDDSADIFAINTDVNFETGNDLEINSSGDVTIGNGDLYVRGGDIHGASGGQLKLRADTNVNIYIDDDNGGSNEFRVLDGGENIRFKVDESGNTQMDGDLQISGGNITEDGSTVAIAISSTENVQIANGRLSGPTDATFNIDSDGDMEFQVDRDGDGTNLFRFKNGGGAEIAQIDESGNIQVDGNVKVSGNSIQDSGGNTVLTFDGSGKISDIATITQDVVIGGSVPSLTLGDGDDEDIKLKFNGDTNDYHIGYDATDDVLKFGIDGTLGAAGKTAFLITSGSYVAMPQGSKWAPTVCVNEDRAGGISNNALWTKIAAAPAFNGNFASRTAVFMITFQPYGLSSQEHDSTFIVKVRYIRDAANTPDTDVTDIFVESLNAGIRSNVDIQEDHFVLTYDGNNGAELWAQCGSAEHQYSMIYCTIMHGGQTRDHQQNEYEGNYDGWQIQSGMLGQASYDSMGTDVVGVRMKKHFKEVMVDDSLLVSGSITAAGAITSSGDIQTSGEITGGKLIADGDTSSGDNAAIGYTAAEGIIITGQGATSDVSIKNDADALVLSIPTGTTNVTVAGNIRVGGNIIKASDGGSTITMDTSDNVTIAGELYANTSIVSKGTSGTGDLYLRRYDSGGITSGEELGRILFGGSENNSSWGNSAAIVSAAKETWTTDSAEGSEMSFWTTDNNSATLDKRMTITHDGKVGIGTTTPVGKGNTGNEAAGLVHLYTTGYPGLVIEGDDHSIMELAGTAGNEITIRFTQGSSNVWTIGMDNTPDASDDGFSIKTTQNAEPEFYVHTDGDIEGTAWCTEMIGRFYRPGTASAGNYTGGFFASNQHGLEEYDSLYGTIYDHTADGSTITTVDDNAGTGLDIESLSLISYVAPHDITIDGMHIMYTRPHIFITDYNQGAVDNRLQFYFHKTTGNQSTDSTDWGYDSYWKQFNLGTELHFQYPGEVTTVDLTAHSMVLTAGEKMALNVSFRPNNDYHGVAYTHGGGSAYTTDNITVGMRVIIFGRKTGGNGVKGL
jgi:hypothetical protein